MSNTDSNSTFDSTTNSTLQNSPTLQGVDIYLTSFLRNLANSIERKQLQPEQLGRVGEFFRNYLFHENMEDVSLSPDEQDRKEFMKFLSLGWYVYTHILDNEDGVEETSDIE